MRIIELEPRGPPSIGGVEKHVFEISKEFQRRGHTVEIWSSDILNFEKGVRDHRRVSIVDGIKVTKFCSYEMPIRLYRGSSIMPKMILKFLAARKKDTIIHSHSFWWHSHSILALLFHFKFRTVIVTPHYDRDSFTAGVAGAFGILKS
jgi:glycosyltransferase involved in cell wall biosynthesis